MKHIKMIITNTVISALIGILIGIVQILLDNYEPEMNSVLFRNAIIGIIIGTMSRFGFVILYTRFSRKPFLILTCVFFIILVGTVVPFIITRSFQITEIAITVLIAEVFAITSGIWYYRYSQQMSRYLDKKKEEISAQH